MNVTWSCHSGAEEGQLRMCCRQQDPSRQWEASAGKPAGFRGAGRERSTCPSHCFLLETPKWGQEKGAGVPWAVTGLCSSLGFRDHQLADVGLQDRGCSASCCWLSGDLGWDRKGQLSANATNPKGLRPSGFTEAGPSGNAALSPVGSNKGRGFGGTGA